MNWLRRFWHWVTHGKCDMCLGEFRRRDLHRDPSDIAMLCVGCLREIESVE